MSQRPAHQATTSSHVVTTEDGPSGGRPHETVTIRRAAVPTDDPEPTRHLNLGEQDAPPPAHHPGPDSAAQPPPTTVRWSQDVVDNEHMNKKKSKKCCIYHKPRVFGEWSDTDSDDDQRGNGCPKCGG